MEDLVFMNGGNTEANPNLDDGFYRDLVRQSADAIIAADAQQHIIFANPAAEEMFGYRQEELIGRELSLLLPERFREAHTPNVARFVSSGEGARYMGERHSHIVGRRADGREIEIGASIVRARNGGQDVYAAIMRDISWRVEMVNRLSDMARLDPLTGQLNRRSFLTLAADQCASAHRYNSGLAFLFLDLDHFKHLNDSYGHEAGDRVLKSFSEVVRRRLRMVDRFCRWGGEEFVAMLPETGLEGATTAAERIRHDVEVKIFELPDGQKTHITVSIGVSHRTGPETDCEEQIRQADYALYDAKRAGRNCVRIWSAASKAVPEQARSAGSPAG